VARAATGVEGQPSTATDIGPASTRTLRANEFVPRFI